MEKLPLFSNEELLLLSDDNCVTLTSRRIRMNYSNSTHPGFISMHLEKISSIDAQFISYPLFLVVGILVLLAAGYSIAAQLKPEVSAILVATGICLVVLFFVTRRQDISIRSDGGTNMRFSVKGQDRSKVLALVHRVEEAKSLLMPYKCNAAQPESSRES